MSRYYTSHMIQLLILSLASVQLVTANYCSNNCYDIYGDCAYYTSQCANSWQCRYCTYYGNCGTYSDCQDSGNDILTWILTSVFISLGCLAAALLCFLIQRRRRMNRLRNQQLQQQLFQQQQIKDQTTVATVEQSYVLGYQVGPPSNNSNNNGQGFYSQQSQQQQQPQVSNVTPQPQQQYNYNYQYQQPQGLQYQCVIPASNQPGQDVSQQTQQLQIQQQQQLYYQQQQQGQRQQQQQPQIYDVKIADANVEIAPR